METVVLAAGEGTRMRPLSASRPKPMLPVAGQPLVAHTVNAAIDAGASSIILVIGYEGKAVKDYFGTRYRSVPIEYAIQEERAGTADAVNAARAHIDGPFVVLNGDNLYDSESLAQLYEGGPAVCAIEVEDPSNYGVLSLEGDQVVDIVEKPQTPPTRLANAGAYAFPEVATNWLEVPQSERGEREITDVVARVIDECTVRAVRLERWLDVGRPWELLAANEWKLGEQSPTLDGSIHESAVVDGQVVVEAGATIRSGVVLEGPVLVRDGATVGPNAYVRGATLIDEGAAVGHAVEVKNSILAPGATVSHLSYVGDSILDCDVNFGAGTTVANLRHDDEPVALTVKGERVSTGRRKFGVVVGENVKTGINTALAPGVRLDPGATTGPGETVDRDR